MSKLEKKLTEALLIRKRIVAGFNTLEEFIQNYQVEDKIQVPVRLETITKLINQFRTVQSEVELLDPENLEEHLEHRKDVEYRYCAEKGFLLGEREDRGNANLSDTSVCASGGNSQHARLPQLELLQFDGTATKWLPFRNNFLSAVGGSDLQKVSKLQYLLASLKGGARAPFDNVELTADNYSVVWRALLKRYDDT